MPNGWAGSSTSNTISTISNATSGTISVSASNSCGSSSPQTLTVAAYSNPTASYSFTTNLLAASFTDLSIGAASWNWDFGDGMTSAVQSPSHTYSSAGTWLACLTATANGCSDSTCHWVAVVSVGNLEAGGLGLTVFPNPSTGLFNIQLLEPAEGYVTDVSRRILFQQPRLGNEHP
ncbi:MAG: PKD domain-containing protein [Bacteroidetes bacterium]|nr:PKD domain-containing protein [Bacteroidota bacterium]